MINFKKIAGFVFSAFFFLLPIFYIPKIGTSYILSQKVFAALFVFVIFSLWLADFWQNKKTVIKYSQFTLFLGGFLLFSAISFWASKSMAQSFFGRGNIVDSFFMLVVYVSLAFFGANLLTKKEDFFRAIKSFVGGSTFLAIGFLWSLFSNFRTNFFAPVESFSMIFALSLSCVFALLFRDREIRSRQRSMVLGLLSFIILSAALLIIDYKVAWFFVFLSAFLTFWRAATEADFDFKRPKVFLPLFAAVIFLALFFIPKVMSYDLNLNYEQSISYDSAVIITQRTFSESIKNIFIGSGPATFAYEFSLHKSKDLGDFGLIFNQGPIALLTMVGSLGVIALGFLILAYLFFMIKGFAFLQSESKGHKKSEREQISSLVFPIGFALFALMFFYKMTIVPMIFSFFVLGAWSFANSKNEKEIKWGQGDYVAPSVAVVIFLFLLIGNVLFVEQYIAESLYQASVWNYNSQKNLDAAIQSGEKALDFCNYGCYVGYPCNDSEYYIGLSQLYIIKASNIFDNNPAIDLSEDLRAKQTKELVSKAESIAKTAVEKDSQNFNAWSNLGLIYANTNFLIDNRTENAIAAYKTAIRLAPNNFDIYSALGNLYEKDNEIQLALDNYQQSLLLNSGQPDVVKKIIDLKKLLKK